MTVGSGSIHVFAMTNQHFELAICKLARFDTDKGVAQLVEGDLGSDAVRFLVRLPALYKGALAGYLKEWSGIIELHTGSFEELNLRFVGFIGFLAHIKTADRVFILAGGLFLVDVDAAAQIDSSPFDVAIPETDNFTGTQAGGNREPVGVDIIVKNGFATQQAILNRKQNLECIRLEDHFLFGAGTLGNGQIFRVERGVAVETAPLDKGSLDRSDRHKRLFTKRLFLAFGLAFLFETTLLERLINDRLEMALAEV